MSYEQHNNQDQYAEAYFQAQAEALEQEVQMMDGAEEFAPAIAVPQLGQSSIMGSHLAATTQSVADHLMNFSVHDRPELSPSFSQFVPTPFSTDFEYPSPDGGLPITMGNSPVSPDVGITPDDYVSYPIYRPYIASTGASLSPNHVSCSIAASAPASMIWSSSAPDALVPMTRENSSRPNQPAVKMERLASFRSQNFSDESATSVSTATRLSIDDPASKRRDFDVFATGGRFDLETPHPCVASASTATLLKPPTSAQMERSASSTSTLSMRSTASQRRARKAAVRVIKNQEAPIAPKPQSDSGSRSHRSDLSNASAKSAATHKRKRRPARPRVYCIQCNDHPKGFRGNHELQRHINAQHVATAKKYVCQDPAQVGIHSDLKPLWPLSECNHCSTGKQYGADYNACAHLRRIHFQERPSRAKGKASVSSGEGRSGKGGGSWPSKADLKPWFEAVYVPINPSSSLFADDVNDMDYDDSNDYNFIGNVSNADDIDLENLVFSDSMQLLFSDLPSDELLTSSSIP